MLRAGDFDASFDASFSGGNVNVGASKKRVKRRPPISPEIREREWNEQIAVATARMQANYQKAGEAQWKARTRRVPKMSPEYDRIANKKEELPPDYESVIYRYPEDKRRKK